MAVLFVLMLAHPASTTTGSRDELAIDWDVERPMLPSRVHAIVLRLQDPQADAAGARLRPGQPARPTSRRVTVDVDPDETQALLDEWDQRDIPVPLKVLDSPYREITKPILDYVRSIRSGNPRDIVTVYLPEYVLGKWWEQMLHNQSALRLKARLLFTPGVMVVSVPWQLQSSEGAERDWIDEPPISRLRARRSAVSARQHPRAGRAAASRSSAEEWTVEVGPVAHGGHCVARHDGQVVFVRHTLPGERVVARVTEGRVGDSFVRADAVEVLEAAPGRVPAPCPYAAPGLCGGCDFQHASLETQRELKGAVVREQFARVAGLDLEVDVHPVPGDEEGLRWRTRVEFAVDGSGRAGLRRHRSREVVPVEDCLIATRGVIDSGVLDTEWPGLESVDVVDAAHPDEPVLVPLPAPEGAGTKGGLVGELARDGDWEGEYVVSARGFWQVHPGRGLDLPLPGHRPARGAPGRPRRRPLCRGGPVHHASRRARRTRTGPCSASRATRRARRERYDATRSTSTTSSGAPTGSTASCAPSSRRTSRADLVVLDPPRTGAGKDVMGLLARMAPRRVVYVACDPSALARDVKVAATHGYGLVSLEAWDAFPMTHHVECIAVLEPRED